MLYELTPPHLMHVNDDYYAVPPMSYLVLHLVEGYLFILEYMTEEHQ